VAACRNTDDAYRCAIVLDFCMGRKKSVAYVPHEVELTIGRDGSVIAVIERWIIDNRVVERKRRLKKFIWIF